MDLVEVIECCPNLVTFSDLSPSKSTSLNDVYEFGNILFFYSFVS